MNHQRPLNAWVRWRQCLHVRSNLTQEPLWRMQVPRGPQIRSCSCFATQSTSPRRHKSTSTAEASLAPNTTSDPPIPAADHRTLGTAQELFINSPYSPGSPLFLPNGTKIINRLVHWLRRQYVTYGFSEVITPTIYKKSLWEKSGHWENYKDDMYQVSGRGASGRAGQEGEDEVYGLKPMNCPGHCLIFKSQRHSYRDLPIRYADFSSLHRNEVSGSLSGLTRVRRFHQDDGHIFCRPDQIMEEISRTLEFVQMSMKVFHFGQYKLVLSTRPETDYIGTPEDWEEAETQLRAALERNGKQWEVNPGDGAFYGPKIDIILRDSDGKDHQTATIQLDFQLPQRFDLQYDAIANSEVVRATPVLIHRAVFGSLERFLALLIEHYDGWWPFWLSPRQCVLLTVNQEDDVVQHAAHIKNANGLSPDARQFGLTIDIDDSPRTLKKKIFEAKEKKYNIIMTVGERNVSTDTVDVNFEGQLRWPIKEQALESALRELRATFPECDHTETLDLKRVSFKTRRIPELLTLLNGTYI